MIVIVIVVVIVIVIVMVIVMVNADRDFSVCFPYCPFHTVNRVKLKVLQLSCFSTDQIYFERFAPCTE